MLIIYGIKSCSTCRQALKVLQANGEDAEIIDVRQQAMPRDLLEEVSATFGDAVLNKRSTAWRGLTDVEKSELSSNKQIDLILEHPLLMKRPLIVQDRGLTTLGWGAAQEKMWRDHRNWIVKGVKNSNQSA